VGYIWRDGGEAGQGGYDRSVVSRRCILDISMMVNKRMIIGRYIKMGWGVMYGGMGSS